MAASAGECCRYPPTVLSTEDETLDFYPFTSDDSWCGEYRCLHDWLDALVFVLMLAGGCATLYAVLS